MARLSRLPRELFPPSEPYGSGTTPSPTTSTAPTPRCCDSNLLLLFFVSFLPFPTRLPSEYITADRAERVAVTFYGLTLLIAGALLSLFWRYALHARLVRPNAGDEEITLLTHRLTPGLGAYAVLIIVGLFSPVAAVIGYLVIALFFLIPCASAGDGVPDLEYEGDRRERARSA
jgi:uncharacterized membrane protein